jgi:cytochrome P450
MQPQSNLAVAAPVFDPFDPALRADPYPIYRQLRSEAPAGKVPGMDIWYFTRHADCQAILRDKRAASDTRKSDVYRQMEDSLRLPADVREHRSFLYLDPPDHTRLRGLVAGVFTPQSINRLKARIQTLIDELLDAAQQQGHFEIVGDLGYPLSFTIICELLGLSIEDRKRFRAWSEELIATMDPQRNPDPAVIERQVTAMREATQYLLQFITERRRRPGDDLVSTMSAAEHHGKMTDDELVSTVILLFAAGQETTVNLISNSVLALLRHPEQLNRLRAQPDLAKQAVEEVLRWDAPTQLGQRIATEDLSIGGVTVRRGAPMIVILGSANRDEALLPDGERFDISRPHIPHLAFGIGPHFCLGAALARLEGEIALQSLVKRFPDMKLSAQGLRRRDTLVLRGLAALHVQI